MQVVYPQILVGSINGLFYASLSLAPAVIFWMLNTINFAKARAI